jgi:putative membrane protein
MHDPYAWPLDRDALVVVPLCLAYARLARDHRPGRWRVACFAASMVLLLAVFATPLDTLALHHLLSAHLLQNVVVAEWAPALVALAIPPALARRVHVPLLLALPLWLGTYFFWHVPAVYDYALEHHHTVLHLEHATYFVTGLLLWWPVVHGRYAPQTKALYLFAAFVLASPLGLLLALLPEPVYDFYENRPTVWGLSHLTDQQLAGITMAAEQAIVFFAAFAWFFFRFLSEEERAAVPTAGSSRPSPSSRS